MAWRISFITRPQDYKNNTCSLIQTSLLILLSLIQINTNNKKDVNNEEWGWRFNIMVANPPVQHHFSKNCFYNNCMVISLGWAAFACMQTQSHFIDDFLDNTQCVQSGSSQISTVCFKKSLEPDSNQWPMDVFILFFYSPPLYQLSYRER